MKSKIITANQIINLSDEYAFAKNIAGSYTVVYVNPDRSDHKELYPSINSNNAAKRLRAIADASKQKVWVWDAYNAHHGHMRPEIGYSSDTLSNYHVVDIYATYKNPTNLMFEDWEDFTYDWMTVPKGTGKWQDIVKFLNSLFDLKWNWLDKYIPGSSKYFEKCKSEFLTRVKK